MSSRRRIGYLVPQFPAQTHILFWRELQALERLGLEPDLFSTREPPAHLVSHVWADEAARRTRYLAPPDARVATGAVAILTKAGPVRLARCLDVVRRAPGLTRRLQLLGLIV